MNTFFISKLIGVLGSFLCLCGCIFIKIKSKSDDLVGEYFLLIGVTLLVVSIVWF